MNYLIQHNHNHKHINRNQACWAQMKLWSQLKMANASQHPDAISDKKNLATNAELL